MCVTFDVPEEILLSDWCLVMAWTPNSPHIVLINALLQIVPKSSAVIGIANENAVPVAGDHSQICRIRDEDELSYRMIVQECQKLGTGLPEKLRRR